MYYAVEIFDENGSIIPRVLEVSNPLYSFSQDQLKAYAPTILPSRWFVWCVSFLLDYADYGEQIASKVPSQVYCHTYETNQSPRDVWENRKTSPIFYLDALAVHPFFAEKNNIKLDCSGSDQPLEKMQNAYQVAKKKQTGADQVIDTQDICAFETQCEELSRYSTAFLVKRLELLPSYRVPGISQIRIIALNTLQLVLAKCVLPRELIPTEFICRTTNMVMDYPLFDPTSEEQVRFSNSELVQKISLERGEQSVEGALANPSNLMVDVELFERICLFINKVKILDAECTKSMSEEFFLKVFATTYGIVDDISAIKTAPISQQISFAAKLCSANLQMHYALHADTYRQFHGELTNSQLTLQNFTTLIQAHCCELLHRQTEMSKKVVQAERRAQILAQPIFDLALPLTYVERATFCFILSNIFMDFIREVKTKRINFSDYRQLSQCFFASLCINALSFLVLGGLFTVRRINYKKIYSLMFTENVVPTHVQDPRQEQSKRMGVPHTK